MSGWRRIALITLALIASVFALLSCHANSLIYHPHAEEVAPNFPETQAIRLTTSDDESIVAWYRAPQAGHPIFIFFDGNGGRPQIWEGRWRRIADSGAGFLPSIIAAILDHRAARVNADSISMRAPVMIG